MGPKEYTGNGKFDLKVFITGDSSSKMEWNIRYCALFTFTNTWKVRGKRLLDCSPKKIVGRSARRIDDIPGMYSTRSSPPPSVTET